ncbi:MAG: hypothetical protein MI757_08340 [Pirellulales bacterium]|nr:hypothetical protein [Pirellulales bacterium]
MSAARRGIDRHACETHRDIRLAMFYFVLLIISLTNLALGYAVATHFGFGPKPESELAAQIRKAVSALPSFAIMGGGKDDTPIDQLAPAVPVEQKPDETTSANSATDGGPSIDEENQEANPRDEEADNDLPSEVRDFAALSDAAAATGEPQHDEIDVVAAEQV